MLTKFGQERNCVVYIHYEEIHFTKERPVDLNATVWSCYDAAERFGTFRAMHHHAGLELSRCVEGRMLYGIKDRAFMLEEGELTPVPANLLHGMRALTDPAKIQAIRYDPRLLMGANYLDQDNDYQRRLQNYAKLPVIRSQQRAIMQAFDAMVEECEQQREHWQQAVAGLMRFLHLRILDLLPAAPEKMESPEEEALRKRLAPALSIIFNRCGDAITLEQLCEVTGMSARSLRRAFQELYGQSPMEYLSHTRMDRAKSYLRDPTTTVAEVARLVGYSTISSFNRHFKLLAGCSPREWRASYYSDQGRK